MKVGSLVERIADGWLLDDFGRPLPIQAGWNLVPLNTPAVISNWKFAPKWDKSMFMFELEGYDGWYSSGLLRELQPPMDLSFIKELQNQTNVPL